jgi:hypothetical protein
VQRACSLLTARARAQLTALLALGGGRLSCEQALGRTGDGDVLTLAPIDNAKVAIRADRAIVGDRTAPVGLRRLGGEWRIDNVLDPSLDDERRLDDPRLRGGSDAQQVRATAAAAADALAAGNYDRFCALLTDVAQAQVLVAGLFPAGSDGADTRPPSRSCGQVVRELQTSPGSAGAVPSPAALKAARVSVRGERATLTVPGENSPQLVRVDGRWLLDVDVPTATRPPTATTRDEFSRVARARACGSGH